jgi:cation:H+ antiporter
MLSLARASGIAALLFLAALPMHAQTPWSMLWTAPVLLLASLFIAWAAESSQYFIAQGFALAILAWLQTLPEFGVEAVLAWHRQTPLLLSNLTGALRLLTGVGWPLIYVTAALSYRARRHSPMRAIHLAPQDSAQIAALIAALAWIFVVFFKGTLGLIDAVILISAYAGYLWLLKRVPPESTEDLEELERVPRAIVLARPAVRNIAIAALFLAGGGLIYIVAEPFLGSLLAVSAAAGIPQFVAVQWIAPFVSEFPEKVSAFYWARTIDKASMALMNMLSSNINQWTLLAAMLPIVLSLSYGAPSELRFDQQQSLELLMTASQSLLGALLLFDLKLVWWEAACLFLLWLVQFVFSVLPGPRASQVHQAVTAIYLLWCAVEVVRLIAARKPPPVFAALRQFLRA